MCRSKKTARQNRSETTADKSRGRYRTCARVARHLSWNWIKTYQQCYHKCILLVSHVIQANKHKITFPIFCIKHFIITSLSHHSFHTFLKQMFCFCNLNINMKWILKQWMCTAQQDLKFVWNFIEEFITNCGLLWHEFYTYLAI